MKWDPKAKTNGNRLIVAALAAVFVMPVLTGTRFSGVIRAQGHDHSQHRSPAQQSVAPSISQPPQQSLKPYGRSEPKEVAPKISDPADATLKVI